LSAIEHAYLLNAPATILLAAPVTLAATLAALATTPAGVTLRAISKPSAWPARLC
jgi:hypothetical protein